MILTANSEVVHRTARRKTGNGWHTTFIGENRNTLKEGQAAPEPGVLYPMAFLVEKDPHAVVKPHFHQANQYQVVVRGGGRLGTHDVGSVAVHYTEAWSAYGPIVAGEDGIAWFTLRNAWDPAHAICRPPGNSYARRGAPTISTARRLRHPSRSRLRKNWPARQACPVPR